MNGGSSCYESRQFTDLQRGSRTKTSAANFGFRPKQSAQLRKVFGMMVTEVTTHAVRQKEKKARTVQIPIRDALVTFGLARRTEQNTVHSISNKLFATQSISRLLCRGIVARDFVRNEYLQPQCLCTSLVLCRGIVPQK